MSPFTGMEGGTVKGGGEYLEVVTSRSSYVSLELRGGSRLER